MGAFNQSFYFWRDHLVENMNIFDFERYKGNQELEVNGLELMTAPPLCRL